MSNPDGVIVGNYRTNIAGNDLNRKYHNPDKKLHPTVCAIKKLVSSIVYPNGEDEAPENDKIYAFIDMHGHSRKKNVFIYGPYYPLHHDRYLRMRIIPKLLSEETTKFRFFSCKFRIERSKEKAARIVLWREYDIMNCFTFEASFHGYLNENR
jgi:cytosolic carboxypeptidase protein 2/3